jgi:hypothetical protein
MSAPVHDDDVEVVVLLDQRGFVRRAEHANPEVKSTGIGESALACQSSRISAMAAPWESPRFAAYASTVSAHVGVRRRPENFTVPALRFR